MASFPSVSTAKSRLFQLSCAARSVFTFFALIVSVSFLKERKVGRATCGPALVRGKLFQAALSAATLWAVEVWTSKVRTTGAVSSRCCTVFARSIVRALALGILSRVPETDREDAIRFRV